MTMSNDTLTREHAEAEVTTAQRRFKARHPMEARRCKAKAGSSGGRCKRPAIPGGSACRVHGGASPWAKRKAAERLADLIDPDRALRQAAY